MSEKIAPSLPQTNSPHKQERAKSKSPSDQVTVRKTRSSHKKTLAIPGSAEAHAKEKQAQTNNLNAPRKKSISVGPNFQAPLQLEQEEGGDILSTSNECADRDECIWSWSNTLKLATKNGGGGSNCDEQVFKYCFEANTHYGIGPDRALYILHKSGYNLKKARAELPLRTLFKQEFSQDDAYAFKNALIYFGKKNFPAKVKQVLPHKTVAALIEHYYRTKKKQNYKSFMDSEMVRSRSDETSESEDDDANQQLARELHEPVCEVCKNVVNKLYPVNGLELCRTCKLYFKATNKHRICAHSAEEPQRRVPKCPPEMRQIAEQFNEMGRLWTSTFENTDDSGDLQVAKESPTVCRVKFDAVRKEQKMLEASSKPLAAALLRKNDTNATTTSSSAAAVVNDAVAFIAQTAQTAPPAANPNRATQHSWTNREKEAAFIALIRFDGDCKIVSEILTTKTPEMVKSFYRKHEERIQKYIKEECEEAEKSDFLMSDESLQKPAAEVIELE